MAYRDLDKTSFVDLHQQATEVYRVQTGSSVYFVELHHDRGLRYAIVRGAPGTDREHVVIRDSDPKIGGERLFDVPASDWIGRPLEVATMRTSPVVAVRAVVDTRAPARADVRVPLDAPDLEDLSQLGPHVQGTDARAISRQARQVVIGGDKKQPYPERHVRYAEHCAALLRSIVKRERLFDDLDPAQRRRLDRALDSCEQLLAALRARVR